jgi:hypothetical protein
MYARWDEYIRAGQCTRGRVREAARLYLCSRGLVHTGAGRVHARARVDSPPRVNRSDVAGASIFLREGWSLCNGIHCVRAVLVSRETGL